MEAPPPLAPALPSPITLPPPSLLPPFSTQSTGHPQTPTVVQSHAQAAMQPSASLPASSLEQLLYELHTPPLHRAKSPLPGAFSAHNNTEQLLHQVQTPPPPAPVPVYNSKQPSHRPQTPPPPKPHSPLSSQLSMSRQLPKPMHVHSSEHVVLHLQTPQLHTPPPQRPQSPLPGSMPAYNTEPPHLTPAQTVVKEQARAQADLERDNWIHQCDVAVGLRQWANKLRFQGKHARAQKLLDEADSADRAAAAHRAACNSAAFLASNVGDQPAFKVDLHGMHKEEALAKLRFHCKHVAALAAGYAEGLRLDVVTGWGKNSGPSGPKLLPAVLSFLEAEKLVYWRPPENPGAVLVQIDGQPEVTYSTSPTF